MYGFWQQCYTFSSPLNEFGKRFPRVETGWGEPVDYLFLQNNFFK